MLEREVLYASLQYVNAVSSMCNSTMTLTFDVLISKCKAFISVPSHIVDASLVEICHLLYVLCFSRLTQYTNEMNTGSCCKASLFWPLDPFLWNAINAISNVCQLLHITTNTKYTTYCILVASWLSVHLVWHLSRRTTAEHTGTLQQRYIVTKICFLRFFKIQKCDLLCFLKWHVKKT